MKNYKNTNNYNNTNEKYNNTNNRVIIRNYVIKNK
jgi:hypothetical protein